MVHTTPPLSQAPLLPAERASPAVLALLAEVNAALAADYGMRRQMLLKRLDVTVQASACPPPPAPHRPTAQPRRSPCSGAPRRRGARRRSSAL